MSNFSTLFGVGGLAGDVLISGSVRASSVAVPALNIDCSQGNYFAKTIAANSTFTFSSPPAAGSVYVMRLDIAHTSGTIAWPASVKWPNGSAPSLTVSRRHKFFFTTSDGGATWDAAAQINYPA